MSQSAKGGRGVLQNFRALYHEYPSQFWVLVGGAFIDRLGGALLFPFFSLYITKKFDVGMTQVGIIFVIFSITGLVSNLIGGALTDRIGRKRIIIFSLVMSALSALGMGLVNRFELFILVVALVGLLAEVGGPAQQAMVADLLPESKRAQGFGILRVVFNLAVVIGPMIGGLLAARSFLLLFIIDTFTSLTTAVIAALALKESKAPPAVDEPQESMRQTFSGYARVLRDIAFTWFLGASMIMVVVYMQMNTTLAVYLRDVHGTTEQMFGYILSLNAAMVVLFQFPITRAIGKFRPLMVMAVGTLFYAFGFAMYGFVGTYVLFLAAMVIITIGEMLVSPTSQSIVAGLAPEEMRGRYMAVYGFSWVIPSAVGPLLAGLVMDYLNPNWIWYGAGVLGLAAAAAYALLERRVGGSRWAAAEKRLAIMEALEEGRITVEEADQQLTQAEDRKFARLHTGKDGSPGQKLRIRIGDQHSAEAYKEWLLPVGLLNIFLNTDARLSNDLEAHLEDGQLRSLIAHSMQNSGQASLELEDGKRVDISREE